MKVTDAAVEWMIGWMNPPVLHLLLDEEPIPYKDLRWHLLAVPDGGRYFVAVHEGMVHFMFEDANGGGAMGGVRTLVTGEEVKSNGGWSSGPGMINKLRERDQRFEQVLVEPVVEAVYHVGSWATLGLAGACWLLSAMTGYVEEFLPGVALVPTRAYADSQASMEQAAIIYAGSKSEAAMSTIWTPWPEHSVGEKPDVGSDLYARTDQSLKRAEARRTI